ncbi:WD40-repeat-containing domain protein [Catenaria anguillulae PL171]|uniref:WD40-repeat-containing domain protein n=1 Tax=Catenaria anguillulae PL171 TaxID=765915 RepID=A0A1Y2HWN6_9FUNG|nr:WD40-repeat-containing domain protein [Catenaria anguillulae PL171]
MLFRRCLQIARSGCSCRPRQAVLLFLISDFLSSVPGGEAASRQFIQSAHDSGVLPLTRTYKGTFRRITPTELSRAAGSVNASGLLTIVQDWISRHGLSTLISAPSLPQPRPPHSIVDTLRLRQTQPSTPHPLASTMRKFEQIGSLFGHTHETYCIMFDRTHSRLITGSNDWIIKIWCAQTGWLLHSLRGHLGPVDYLTINRENTMIASGCHDGAVRVWALATGKPVATLRTPQVARHPDYPNAAPDEPNARINRITAIVWSTTPFPENRIIVAATKDDGMLRVWRWVRGESTQEPARFLYPEQPLAISFKTRETDYPVCLSMDPSGLLLAAGGSDGVVRVYSTGPLVRHRFVDPPTSVFGDGSSSSLASASNLGAAGLPPLPVPPGGAPPPAVPAPASNDQDEDAMDVDPPGEGQQPSASAGTSDTSPTYPLLQPADMPCIAYLKHDGPMVDVQFSNKGDRLLAYAEDGQAHVWSLNPASGHWVRVPLSKDPIVPDPALAPPPLPAPNRNRCQTPQARRHRCLLTRNPTALSSNRNASAAKSARTTSFPHAGSRATITS